MSIIFNFNIYYYYKVSLFFTIDIQYFPLNILYWYISNRPGPSLETIVEDESLVIQATHQIADKSSQLCHGLSQRTDHTTEGLSDTVMSCLFAQDESNEHESICTNTKVAGNGTMKYANIQQVYFVFLLADPLPLVMIENNSTKNDTTKLLDDSHSSQLTNDQLNSQESSAPSIIIKKPPKSTKRSFRMNPDGTRTGISRSSTTSKH